MCLFVYRNADTFSMALVHEFSFVLLRLRRISCNDVQSCLTSAALALCEVCVSVIAVCLSITFVGIAVGGVAAIKLVGGSVLKWHASLSQYGGVIARGLRVCQTPLPPGAQTVSVNVGVGLPIGGRASARRVPVVAPIGATAGATVMFRHVDGSMYTVSVPFGVPAGHTFWATLPAVPVVASGEGGQIDVGRTVEMLLNRGCTACLAEVYCCCLPCYLLSQLLAPLFLALSLGCAAVGALCRSAGAGCAPLDRLAYDWWPTVLVILHEYDRASSALAFADDARWRLCACGCLRSEAESEAVVVMGQPVEASDYPHSWSSVVVVQGSPAANAHTAKATDDAAALV